MFCFLVFRNNNVVYSGVKYSVDKTGNLNAPLWASGKLKKKDFCFKLADIYKIYFNFSIIFTCALHVTGVVGQGGCYGNSGK